MRTFSKLVFFLVFIFFNFNSYVQGSPHSLNSNLIAFERNFDSPEEGHYYRSKQHKVNKAKNNLAICTIFKDCAPFLKEWIEFHRLIGVDHFFLFDNSSQDNPLAVLEEYLNQGIVTLINWPNKDEHLWKDQVFAWVTTTQLPAYDHGCALARKKKFKWLAFIDSDEFLVPMSFSTITKFLSIHSDVPGICLNWAVYGTSDVYEIPPNCLMIELLTTRAHLDDPINKHTKSIVRPEQYAGWSWPTHACHYKNGAKAYFAPQEEARVNHYINRTVQFFYDHKIKNKETVDNVKWNEEYTHQFLRYGNDEKDLTMNRFIPQLRKKMGFSSNNLN